MTHHDVEIVVDGKDILGEVPLWCQRTAKLWWIDVRRPSLQSFDPASRQHETYILPLPIVGSYALRDSGGFLLAADDGLYAYRPDTGAVDVLVAFRDHPKNRYNDGKADRAGRFWVGTMNDTPGNPDGSFYRVDTDLSMTSQFSGVYCPNAIAFSPDSQYLYYGDSKEKKIWRYEFDLAAGALGKRTLFRDVAYHQGIPDGSTVDAEGFVWNAEYGGGRLVRYAPDGSIDRIVELPVSLPSSCTFGGSDLSTLYVTTANQRLSAAQRKTQPYAGALLALNVGVKGLAEPYFKG